jgi:hypothetical protein
MLIALFISYLVRTGKIAAVKNYLAAKVPGKQVA